MNRLTPLSTTSNMISVIFAASAARRNCTLLAGSSITFSGAPKRLARFLLNLFWFGNTAQWFIADPEAGIALWNKPVNVTAEIGGCVLFPLVGTLCNSQT